MDVTALSIEIKSVGIREATVALDALAVAATNVANKSTQTITATSGLTASQAASVAGIDKLIAGFQKQVDLLGANTSQTNAYVASLKGATQLEQQMAQMLGAEVDAYKRLSQAQSEALRMNNALNAANERQKAISQSRDIEQRAAAYKQLAAAQTEALTINRAMDAAAASQKAIEQARQVEMHAQAYRTLAAAQTEAIKMNAAYDASLRRLATEEAARKQALLNATLQQGHDLARGLSGSLGALWLTYGNIGMMLAGVAIGASLKEAVTGFAAVEYQMTFVKALAEDTTHSVAALTEAMHNVAGALGIAPESAAKGLRALTQAGLNTTDALATLPVAFKLATVGELALESAALAATGVMNAYGLAVKDLEHIGDVMAKAGAMSAASVDSISVSMKYSAGTAEQYGVSLEKLGATLTLLGKRGITGSSAGVAANNLIAEIYSPSSEKAIKAAAALGVKAYADGVRQPLEDVIASMKSGLGKFDQESQGILLEAMFGKKGGKAFYALAQGTKADFKDIENSLTESSGFVANVYKANLATVQGQMNLTKSAITNMFAKVGEESSEPIKQLLVSIRQLAGSQAAQDMFVGLTQSIVTFVKVVVPAALALGAFFTAAKVGTAVMAASAAAMAFLESTIAIGLIPTIKALNLAMMANPLGLVIGLVTVLAGAYLLLKRNKESVHDLHKKDMDNAAETLKAGNEEIEMLKKQLSLRNQNIRGDAAENAVKEMQANEAVEKIRQRIIENNTNYYTALGKAKNAGSFNASGPRENVQLEKDLAEAQKTYSALADQNKKINDLKKRVRDEDQRMDAEELAKATPKAVGTQIYGKDEKGAKGAARDIYAEEITKQNDIIRASKTAMQNFEDQMNNKFAAGEIGKLKLIQETGARQVEELGKQRIAIAAQLEAAQGKKNGRAETQKYSDELVANTNAVNAARLKSEGEVNVQLNKYAEDSTKFRIQELEAQGKFGQVAAMRWSADNKVAFQQAEQDIKDYGDKFPIITERFEQLKKAREAAMTDGYEKEAMKSFMDLSNETRNALKGVQTASEGQGLAAMFTAAQEASATLADNMDELRMRMSFLVDPKDINEAQAQLTNLGESQRKLWAGVGESIGKSLESAFGKGGKATADLIKIGQNYANLEDKTGDARIKAFGDAAGAAKGFFKEGSTGYKVMETAEKGFRILQLAGMAQSLAANVSTALATAAAWIPAIYASFMGALGPYGAVAATVAIGAIGLAALSKGGGGGATAAEKQKTQGTGSVLGMNDAKSESIVNSLSIMEKNSGLGLAQGNQMVTYLKAVADNITNLSSLIVRSTGITGSMSADTLGGAASLATKAVSFLDPILGKFTSKIVGKVANAIFGGNVTTLDTGFTASKTTVGSAAAGGFNASQYTNTKKDGGLFRSDKYSTNTTSLGADANNQFAGIISNMSGALKEASKALGVDGAAFNRKLESFVIDIGQISLKDLKGDEIQAALEAVFSKLGDDMAKFAFTDFAAFQKVGEGFLETISRVANDVMQVKDVFAVLGKSFQLTGTAAANVAENLISAAGSLETLTEGTKYFVDNFLTEAERMGPITASVQNVMAQLGYSTVDTVAEFSKLVRSLDLTNPASQALYAQLLAIAPSFKEAADYATELTEGTVTLTKTQQKLLDAVTKSKSVLQDSYNSESSALQGVIDKTKSFIATLATYKDSLKVGTNSPLTNMQKYAEARSQYDKAFSAASTGDPAAASAFQAASSAFLEASKVVNASGEAYSNDFSRVQVAIDYLMAHAQPQVDVAQASLDALNKQVQGLIDVNKSVMSVTDAITTLQAAITSGNAGGLTAGQMDTTYTPTAAQLAAATPASGNSNTAIATAQPVVVAIEANTAAIQAQTIAMSQQTGAVVGAVYQSAENSADSFGGSVTGLGALLRSAANKVQMV